MQGQGAPCLLHVALWRGCLLAVCIQNGVVLFLIYLAECPEGKEG